MIRVTVIRGGVVVKELSGRLPLSFVLVDENAPWTGFTYYRLIATDSIGGMVVANPVFVEFRAE